MNLKIILLLFIIFITYIICINEKNLISHHIYYEFPNTAIYYCTKTIYRDFIAGCKIKEEGNIGQLVYLTNVTELNKFLMGVVSDSYIVVVELPLFRNLKEISKLTDNSNIQGLVVFEPEQMMDLNYCDSYLECGIHVPYYKILWPFPVIAISRFGSYKKKILDCINDKNLDKRSCSMSIHSNMYKDVTLENCIIEQVKSVNKWLKPVPVKTCYISNQDNYYYAIFDEKSSTIKNYIIYITGIDSKSMFDSAAYCTTAVVPNVLHLLNLAWIFKDYADSSKIDLIFAFVGRKSFNGILKLFDMISDHKLKFGEKVFLPDNLKYALVIEDFNDILTNISEFQFGLEPDIYQNHTDINRTHLLKEIGKSMNRTVLYRYNKKYDSSNNYLISPDFYSNGVKLSLTDAFFDRMIHSNSHAKLRKDIKFTYQYIKELFFNEVPFNYNFEEVYDCLIFNHSCSILNRTSSVAEIYFMKLKANPFTCENSEETIVHGEKVTVSLSDVLRKIITYMLGTKVKLEFCKNVTKDSINMYHYMKLDGELSCFQLNLQIVNIDKYEELIPQSDKRCSYHILKPLVKDRQVVQLFKQSSSQSQSIIIVTGTLLMAFCFVGVIFLRTSYISILYTK